MEVAPGFWVAPPSVQMPMPAAFTVLSARNGRQVARVTTDSAGAYAVALPPGSYVLVPDPLSLSLGCSVSRGPIEVTVHPKQYTLLNIFYFSAGPPCVLQAVR